MYHRREAQARRDEYARREEHERARREEYDRREAERRAQREQRERERFGGGGASGGSDGGGGDVGDGDVDEVQREKCRDFLLLLALCHTVVVEQIGAEKKLSASSPDEAALVSAAPTR